MIRNANFDDLPALAVLGIQLWPGHSADELSAEFADILRSSDAAFFLAFSGEKAVGFAQCQLRHDYVEGTESSPVGYLEGIFVRPEHRRRGISAALLSACESWAKEKGCQEFASDCELTNDESLRFHLALGFREANRIICFTKKL